MRITLASAITIARLLFLPPIVWLLLGGERRWAFTLLLVVLAADLMDGALARRRHEETPLGRLLDPAIDKIVFLTVFGALVWIGDLHWLSFALLGGMQLGVAIGGAFWLRARHGPPPARPLGKTASFILSLGLLATLLNVPYDAWLVYAGITLVSLAGFDYLINMIRTFKRPSDRDQAREVLRDKTEIGVGEGP